MIPRPAIFLVILAAAAQAEPAVTKTTWRGFDAYKIADGRSEAVIVPALGGRIMGYGLAGGLNWIWNGEHGAERKENAQFWGGDKTYIGPHTMWAFTMPKTWPPPAPDVTEHRTEILEGKKLRTTSPTWESYATTIVREYSFDANGEFVVEQTIQPAPESRLLGAVWEIAQIIPTDFVYVPLNAKSPYKDNFYWFGWGTPKDNVGANVISPTLLQITPKTGTVWKLGSHPKRPALAAVKDGMVLVGRAEPQEGAYPEGADGAGLSIEVYHHDLLGAGEYTELEFLSPLRRLDKGASLTTRWNVHPLPKEAKAEDIDRLLTR